MDIKLIVTDMDGTFLHSDMSYNKNLFKELYNKMKDRGIRFVVASSNQYYQLKSFFGDIQDEITYVCENGALIFDKKENIFKAELPKKTVKEITDFLSKNENIKTCVCGLKSAYILRGQAESRKVFPRFFHRLEECDSFDEIDDDIVKLSLFISEGDQNAIEENIKKEIGHLITPVTSGNMFIDLIIPGCNKGSAIRRLCEMWDISLDECIAFGDSCNDLEMLQSVKYGYAMENADDRVKKIAPYKTLSNNEDGVLNIINKLFEDR